MTVWRSCRRWSPASGSVLKNWYVLVSKDSLVTCVGEGVRRTLVQFDKVTAKTQRLSGEVSRERETNTSVHFHSNLESPPQQDMGGHVPNTALRRASIFTLAFVMLCILVAFDTTRTVDWWGLTL